MTEARPEEGQRPNIQEFQTFDSGTGIPAASGNARQNRSD